MPQVTTQGPTHLTLEQAREITDLLDLLVEIALVDIVDDEIQFSKVDDGLEQ